MKLRLFILSGLCAWIGVSCGGKKENTGQESIRPVRVVKVESLGHVAGILWSGTG